jgi:hypothetical protein
MGFSSLRSRASWLALWLLWACGCASTQGPASGAVPATVAPQSECLTGEAWPEADRLFTGDPRWRGGDAAYSVDLGDERSLWLFGDSFVASSPVTQRAGLGMVRNSVAVMRGRDPRTATLRFAVPRDGSGAPAAFFEGRDGRWYWPAHGVRDGDALVVFLYRMAPGSADDAPGFGFRFEGSDAVRITNPDAEPEAWQLQWLALPDSVEKLAVGASVLVHDGQVYAYAVGPAPPHPLYLLRWSLAALHQASLPAPEAWTGSGFGRGPPAVIVSSTAMELSAHRDPTSGQIVIVHSQGFGAAPLVERRAARPEGPFSDPVTLFRPAVQPLQLAYAGKAHPQLAGAGAGTVLTYVVNSTDGDAVLRDEGIYYPKFVKVSPGRCAAASVPALH